MQLAILKAEEGIRNGQSPFGAVIVRNGKVISCDHNQVWESTDPTAHAEIITIRNAARETGNIDLSGSIIYTTCEPCPMCFAAIHWARITKIVYGATVDDAMSMGFNEIPVYNRELKSSWNTGMEIVERFMYPECRDLFKLWKELCNNPY